MEHTCYKCGAAVTDGIPFCPHCAAPQIRVVGIGEREAATPPLTPGTPGDLQPPAVPVSLERHDVPQGTAARAGFPYAPRVDWSKAIPGTILGGVLMVLFAGLLPLPVVFIFVWMLAGGALAVMLYKRRAQSGVTSGMGARIGAAAGLAGFILVTILTVLDFVFLGVEKMRAALVETMRDAAARNPYPPVQEWMQRMTSPKGLAIVVTLSLLLSLIAFVGLSSIGGAIGASMFGKRDSDVI